MHRLFGRFSGLRAYPRVFLAASSRHERSVRFRDSSDDLELVKFGSFACQRGHARDIKLTHVLHTFETRVFLIL